jgi:hypothetical protein
VAGAAAGARRGRGACVYRGHLAGDRNPTFAVGLDQGDAWRAAAGAVRAFRASYRAALERWRAGVRAIVFPVGTWWRRTFHGAEVNDVVLAV